jgi:putative transposase
MQPTMARDLALDALLIAVWRRKPKQPVIMHSDHGSLSRLVIEEIAEVAG